MKISIEHDARRCFKEELRIKHDESIWCIVRYGGNSSIQPGYSLGIISEKSDGEIVSVEKDGSLFL